MVPWLVRLTMLTAPVACDSSALSAHGAPPTTSQEPETGAAGADCHRSKS